MNVNEVGPFTDRERSFGQDGHPGRSGYGVESDTKKTIPLPPLQGGVALAGGIVLVIIGAKNKP